jgi:hypothetical protein
MDEFFYQFFSEPDPSEEPADNFFAQLFCAADDADDLPINELPEIRDTIARVLLCRGISAPYTLQISPPCSTQNPQVQRLNIHVLFENVLYGPLVPLHTCVDDFDLVFSFAKKGQ